jgi:hypothetical protein
MSGEKIKNPDWQKLYKKGDYNDQKGSTRLDINKEEETKTDLGVRKWPGLEPKKKSWK